MMPEPVPPPAQLAQHYLALQYIWVTGQAELHRELCILRGVPVDDAYLNRLYLARQEISEKLTASCLATRNN